MSKAVWLQLGCATGSSRVPATNRQTNIEISIMQALPEIAEPVFAAAAEAAAAAASAREGLERKKKSSGKARL